MIANAIRRGSLRDTSVFALLSRRRIDRSRRRISYSRSFALVIFVGYGAPRATTLVSH